MIGSVHEISVPVTTGVDNSLTIDGKLCLEMVGQTVDRDTYADYADALGVSDSAIEFAVPDRRGRVAIGEQDGVAGRELLNIGGSEQVTLTPGQMPAHTHALMCDNQDYLGTQHKPAGRYLGSSPIDRTTGEPVTHLYSDSHNGATMASAAIAQTGASQPHDNMQPFIVSRFFVQVEA